MSASAKVSIRDHARLELEEFKKRVPHCNRCGSPATVHQFGSFSGPYKSWSQGTSIRCTECNLVGPTCWEPETALWHWKNILGIAEKSPGGEAA